MTTQDDDPIHDDIPDDDWAEFRNDDADPIRIEEFKRLDLQNLPEDVGIRVLDDYFPEVTIWRDYTTYVCEIQEHLYTKYWGTIGAISRGSLPNALMRSARALPCKARIAQRTARIIVPGARARQTPLARAHVS